MINKSLYQLLWSLVISLIVSLLIAGHEQDLRNADIETRVTALENSAKEYKAKADHQEYRADTCIKELSRKTK